MAVTILSLVPRENAGSLAFRYLICDTEAERPASGNLQGDLAFTKDTNKFWKATGPTIWVEVSHAQSHSAADHSGDVIPGANQDFGAFYSDFSQIAAPANPAAGTRRLFMDSVDGKMKVRTSAGSSVSLEEGGGGADTKVEVFEGGVQVGTVARRLDFDTSDFNITEDTPNDQFDVGLNYGAVAGQPAEGNHAHTHVSTTGQTANDHHAQAHGNADHTAAPTPSAVDIGDAAITGTDAGPARGDHQHAVAAPVAGYPVDVAAAEADGTGTAPARSDHQHAHGTGYLPNAHHAQAHADVDHSGANRVEIQDEGALVATRAILNFVGACVIAADDVVNSRVNVTIASVGGGSTRPWEGAIVGAAFDGNPTTLLIEMQQGPDVVNPTPTNIGTTVARICYFKLKTAITVNRIRWYGVGAVSLVYHVAIYRDSDSVRMSGDHEITTALNAWGSVTSTFTLAADTLYFVAVSADTTGTTAGLRAFGPTFVAATSLISVIPTSWPGNLGLGAGKLDGGFFAQFAVTAGVLPATAPARAVQAAWTGGMPAFFLDNDVAA